MQTNIQYSPTTSTTSINSDQYSNNVETLGDYLSNRTNLSNVINKHSLKDPNKEAKILDIISQMSPDEIYNAATGPYLSSFSDVTKLGMGAKILTSRVLSGINFMILLGSSAAWATSALTAEDEGKELSFSTNIAAAGMAFASVISGVCVNYLSENIKAKQQEIEKRCQFLSNVRLKLMDKNINAQLPIPITVDRSTTATETTRLLRTDGSPA
ncbi:hypothetical protein [Yersinia aleksiciae]|uniref:hypothetical protein n=1 Tax=Yersinia aleksiciae TaxID=263819 RepID=UPI00119ED729|nr:hypothetical protein [Yersinia aleksiciae]